MVVITPIVILYSVLLIVLMAGWSRAIRKKVLGKTFRPPFISVVVPVRNEEKNLDRLLQSIRQQDHSNFEILVVDDHSTDRSVEIAMKNGATNQIVLRNQGQGKKSAITTAVRAAKGSLIATTDADCVLPRTWLTDISLQFHNEKVNLAFGGVRMTTNGKFFSVLQSMEFASLIGSGAATAALGFSTLCNGANLVYRKAVFESVNGYDGNLTIASGDDEFLMRKIQKHFPGSVFFLNSPTAVVDTESQSNFSVFLQQRLRWASKWRYNSSRFTVALSIFILLAQVSWIGCLALLIISFRFDLLTLMLTKMVLEFVFLLRVCRWMKAKWNGLAFLTLQVVYPFYVLGVGIASNFVKGSWKGRRI